jgi:hypothetical protein
MRKVYERIRQRFADDSAVKESLDQLAAEPVSETGQKKLAAALQPRLTDDQSFAQELHEMIEACRQSSPDQAQFITRVYGSATVGQVVNVERIDTFNTGGTTMN